MIKEFELLLSLSTGISQKTEIVDATGRSITVPDRIQRILPAGPPAAVLLVAQEQPDALLTGVKSP